MCPRRSVCARARRSWEASVSYCPLTLDAAERLRKRGGQRRDHSPVNRHLVTSAIYQLDWSALRMGVLPLGIRELTERVRDAPVKIVVGSLHPVTSATRVGAPESPGGRYVEKQRDIRSEASRRQTVRRAYLGLRQSPAENLIRVGGQEKPIEQNHLALDEGRQNLTRDQLRARRHEQQRFGGICDLLLGVKQDLPDRVADRGATWLAQGDAGNTSRRQTIR